MIEWLRLNGPWLGPLISGASLFLAAVAAWITYFTYHRRSLANQWVDSHRVLYAEFWKDPAISRVRTAISNDLAYARFEAALLERMTSDQNKLSLGDNAILEDVDQFCALLRRIRFLEKMNTRQKKLWDLSYDSFWLEKLRKRKALIDYINQYWPTLLS
jgi:small-conductance mechanosensitive channel